jgi:hypothetical protein
VISHIARVYHNHLIWYIISECLYWTFKYLIFLQVIWLWFMYQLMQQCQLVSQLKRVMYEPSIATLCIYTRIQSFLGCISIYCNALIINRCIGLHTHLYCSNVNVQVLSMYMYDCSSPNPNPTYPTYPDVITITQPNPTQPNHRIHDLKENK